MTALFIKVFSAIISIFIFLGVVPPKTVKEINSTDANVSFYVIADVHVETNNKTVRDSEIKAFYDMSKVRDDVDTLIMAGDIVMNGQLLEFSHLDSILSKTKPAKNIHMVTGNHDVGNSEGNYEVLKRRYIDARKYITGVNENELYYSFDENGYRFILIAPENHCVHNAEMSLKQFEWMIDEIEYCVSKGLPIFIFSHYEDYSIEGNIDFKEALSQYDNLFLFYGHTHMYLSRYTVYPLNAERNSYTINLPCFKDGNDRMDSIGYGIGCAVDVFDDYFTVSFRAFETATWIEDHFYRFDLI